MAAVGLMGLSAQAALPVGYGQVNVKLIATIQTNSTFNGINVKYRVTKVKIINKDVLSLIGKEFNLSFTNAQLAVSTFWNGSFSVLDKNGNVLVANATSSNSDNYQLYIKHGNDTYTGTAGSSASVYNYNTVGWFFYTDAGATNYFQVYGLANVTDTQKSTGSTESFKLTGADNGNFNGNNMVVSGTITATGKF